MARADDIEIVMVGCGVFAHRYHVPTVAADAGARIVAIADPTPSEATRALAAATGAALVDNIDGVPAPAGRAMAIVSTPHTLHAAHVGAALGRGWHVLVDKPFVLHADEARALAARAETLGLVNGVAFNRRLDASCMAARRIIEGGGIGAVRYVEAVQLGYERAGWFLDPALGGGGPFTGRASHMADLIPWLIGLVPSRLCARLRGDGGARTDRGGFIALQFGALECHLACIEEGWHGWDEVRIFGDDGMIELRRPLRYPVGWTLCHLGAGDAVLQRIEADPTPGGATADFLVGLRRTGNVACSFRAAVTSVAIVEAAFISARGGGAWIDLPP